MTGYTYDAAGNRVAKGTNNTLSCDTTASGYALASQYLLGPSGEQMTELNSAGAWVHTNVMANGSLIATFENDNMGAHFYLTDWLGTRRVQTNYLGAVENTWASLPYGDALAPSNNLDPTEQHFTGKERDAESGLDYFGARYYASTMGRFISPDWSAKAEPVPYAKLDNPQSLNLYAYMMNNPLAGVDPDGHLSEQGEQLLLDTMLKVIEDQARAQKKAQQQNNTTGYNTQDAAAKAVLTGLNPKSIKENTEYAGLIYKDKNGLYHYTNPNGGNGDSSPVGSAPAGTTVYGDYHTHGDYSRPGPGDTTIRTDAAHDRYNSDHFSSTDMQQNRDSARSNPAFRGYLGTPSGALLIYNPITRQEGPLQ
jgi:RHS repeat-associated protein